jgi:hypothetical protein
MKRKVTMKIKSISSMLNGLMIVSFVAFGIAMFTPAISSVSAYDCPGGGTAESAAACPSSLQSGANAAKGADTNACLFTNNKDKGTPGACQSGLFTNIVNALLFIIGAVSVIMIIYGGIRYTISGGEAKNVTAAKDTIIYSIVGLVVAILAYAIVNFVITNLT